MEDEVSVMLIAYLIGWLATTLVALFAGTKIRDLRPSGPLAIGSLAVLAGMLWPLVITGIVQLALVAVVAKKLRAAGGRSAVDPEAELVNV